MERRLDHGGHFGLGVSFEFAGADVVNKIIQLYDSNEETRYKDHFAKFKINSNDLKKMFGIDISKCKESINSNYEGNYSFGNKSTIDDDVEEYVEKNLLRLYKVDRVYLYIKDERMRTNNRKIENER